MTKEERIKRVKRMDTAKAGLTEEEEDLLIIDMSTMEVRKHPEMFGDELGVANVQFNYAPNGDMGVTIELSNIVQEDYDDSANYL